MRLHPVFFFDSPFLSFFRPPDLLFNILIDHWVDILFLVSKSLFILLNEVLQMMGLHMIFFVLGAEDVVNGGQLLPQLVFILCLFL